MMTDADLSMRGRRHDLDWIRIGAFGLLILYHVGMFYGPWDWHVKSPRIIQAIDPLARLTSPWRLTLLYFVSGAATRFMADKMPVSRFVRERAARLALPLLFGILIVVPPQTYFQIVESLGYTGGWATFYLHYLTGAGGWRAHGESIVTPTYNHLWFVAYLLAYTLMLAGVMRLAPEALRRLGERVERSLAGTALLLAPMAYLAALHLWLEPSFPVNHGFVGDWYEHAASLPVFLFGFLAAKSQALRDGFIRLRWPAVAAAVAGYAVWAAGSWAADHGTAFPLMARVVIRSAYGAEQWGALVAILGFVGRADPKGGPVLRYLTPAIFPFYIVHQTVIVATGHYLARLRLPLAVEALTLLGVTVAACFGAYELGRRTAWLAPWLGLRFVRGEGRSKPQIVESRSPLPAGHRSGD